LRKNSRDQVGARWRRSPPGSRRCSSLRATWKARPGADAAWMGELSRWLQRRRLGASDLSEEVIERFFDEGGGRGCQRRSRRSLELVAAHLVLVGRSCPRGTVPPGRTPVEAELLGAFGVWCLGQRGLTRTTTDQYVRRAATFLELWRPDGDVAVAELDGRGVLGTVRAAAEVMPAPSLRCMVTALRSFLRFLYVTGRARPRWQLWSPRSSPGHGPLCRHRCRHKRPESWWRPVTLRRVGDGATRRCCCADAPRPAGQRGAVSSWVTSTGARGGHYQGQGRPPRRAAVAGRSG